MLASRKTSISWRALAIEVFFLCVGVLIALSADNWREQYNNRQLAHKALTHVYGEIEYNKDFLSERLNYYEAVVHELDSVIQLNSADIRFLYNAHIPVWRGYNPPILRSSTFQAAIASQAMQHMEFSVADKLSRVYSFQEFYADTIDKFLSAVVSRDSTSLGRVRSTMREMAQMGRELEGTYKDMLGFLEASEIKKAPTESE